jgi:hypothetical protein
MDFEQKELCQTLLCVAILLLWWCSLYCGTTAIECEYIEDQPEKEIS